MATKKSTAPRKLNYKWKELKLKKLAIEKLSKNLVKPETKGALDLVQ